MEYWDAYDKDMKKIRGVTLVRGEPVLRGYYHLICHVTVQHRDGTYLAMQRDPAKRWGGGQWEITAGGAALMGETPLDCALRELREETGLDVATLRQVGWEVREKWRAIVAEFFCLYDGPKDCITLQKGETVAYKWIQSEDEVEKRNDVPER